MPRIITPTATATTSRRNFRLDDTIQCIMVAPLPRGEAAPRDVHNALGGAPESPGPRSLPQST
jgi:hypothetical protein